MNHWTLLREDAEACFHHLTQNTPGVFPHSGHCGLLGIGELRPLGGRRFACWRIRRACP